MDCDNLRNYYYLDVACKGHYNKMVLRFLEDNDALPDMTAEDLDIIAKNNANWISVNYYFPVTVGTASLDDPTVGARPNDDGGADDMTTYTLQGVYKGYANPNLTKSEYGMEQDPVGMRVVLDRLADRYDLPMIITENGCGCPDELTPDGQIHDSYRIKFLGEMIEQCKLAINDGANLIGYCPWSAFDLISTHQGIRKRYGFIYVNRDETDLKDLKRIPKDSFYWYKKVIATNGEEL
jgi:6-phospho-beta-glucosidase